MRLTLGNPEGVDNPDELLRGMKRFFAALKIFILAESLGGVESMINHSATMSHKGSMNDEDRARIGIFPGTLRISVGIENVADLIADLETGLAAM